MGGRQSLVGGRDPLVEEHVCGGAQHLAQRHLVHQSVARVPPAGDITPDQTKVRFLNAWTNLTVAVVNVFLTFSLKMTV